MGTTLNELYNLGLNYINKVESETNIFITRQQKMLQTQIDDAKLLVTYEQKLKEVISHSPQLIIAESIQQIIDNLDLLTNKDIDF
ncbi:MAG: hypothetical protein PSV35_09785, partial [bacterium]|nr:hypothetical protein [bacterium]